MPQLRDCAALSSAQPILDTMVGEERTGMEKTNSCESCVGAARVWSSFHSSFEQPAAFRSEQLSTLRNSPSGILPLPLLPSQGSSHTHLNPEPWQPLQEELIPHPFEFTSSPSQESCRGCGHSVRMCCSPASCKCGSCHQPSLGHPRTAPCKQEP